MPKPNPKGGKKGGKVIMRVTNEGSVHYPGKEKHAVIYRTGKLEIVPEKDENEKK